MKTPIVAALTALIAFGTLLPAHAENGRNAALLGGLAAGALVGGAIASQPRAPAPVVEEEVIEAPPPRCFFRQEPLYDRYGNVVETRRVRVCR